MSQLELFYKEGCPYCRKVLDFLEDSELEPPELLEINENEAARQRLEEVGGKVQVPCLFVDGEPLYESDAIIEWFEKNRGEEGT